MTGFKKREGMILKRKQMVMNQMAVAAAVGVSQSYYCNIENGYITPDEEIANKLIEVLGLDPDYFSEHREQEGA